MSRSAAFNPATLAASLLLALHAGRSALDPDTQLDVLRLAAFVPARAWALVAPEWVMGRLAAAPRDAARIAAFWLDGGATPWTPLSYALVHAGWAHVVSNAAILALLGAPTSRRLSPAAFAALLSIGAAAGAAAQMSAADAAFAPLVGASACVCALIGALARAWTAPGGGLATSQAPPDSLGAALRRPQALAALAAGVVAILASALAGEDAASIGWRAHLGGFLAGFFCFSALPARRKTKHAQTCRSPRTDASSDSD